MKVIRPTCRAHFTPADYAFIGSVMPKAGAKEPLFHLFSDAGSLDVLLDDPRLFRAVVDLRGCLSLSLPFYFYVLVRHALLREDVRDREIADYVASVLAEFAVINRWRHDEVHPLDHLSDMLEVLEGMD